MKDEKVEVKTYYDRDTGKVTKMTANGTDMPFEQDGALVQFLNTPKDTKCEEITEKWQKEAESLSETYETPIPSPEVNTSKCPLCHTTTCKRDDSCSRVQEIAKVNTPKEWEEEIYGVLEDLLFHKEMLPHHVNQKEGMDEIRSDIKSLIFIISKVEQSAREEGYKMGKFDNKL